MKTAYLLFFLSIISHLTFAAPEKPQTPPLATVFVQSMKASPLFDLLSYPARINPKVNATVLSEADGVVFKIVAPLGTAVSKNQKMILIKNTDPIYDYAPFVVTAPVKGTVSSMEVTEGSRVARGQRLMSITDPKKVSVLIEVAASDLSAIHMGLQGELKLSATDAKPVPVKVIGVSPFIDSATGTATAELSFNLEDGQALPPGIVGTVSFRAREHKGFEIPESAVVYRGKDTFVRVVEAGKAKYVPITAGQTRRGMTEILKGLTENTEVIIRSSSFLSEGESVNVQKAEGRKS